MDLRQLVRGSVEWDRIERVVHTLADRHDREVVRVEFLEADNWLSTPCVIDDEWFVKIVSRQNALVHAVLTTGRNVGAVSAGTGGFFDRFDTPREMVEHEYEATQRMREIGVNAPQPIEAFEVNGLGVLVLEYLPDFESLGTVADEIVADRASELFEMLATLHDHGLAHGDLRGENILVADGNLYFIDATSVHEDRVAETTAYDLACALAVLEPRIGARRSVEAAASVYGASDLLAARRFLDFVRLRPDHEFDSTQLRSELEKAAELDQG
ncbi:RIO1 family regulatory kinase/ATPase domain-containing protein [Natronobacterium gregoryi]|uniref:non-specific serine/threonine protein kinase n=2 Tax=Natronobacterium gregoryi TaxID=44930 RepID=L0AML6_NATGS|nr:RIO1 family regulatory kinase/ATPase [Natronobacterium gregoryi]AFZ74442.1 Mn2+-dependent serine/threonine protein kinase [Natronobacterium gregoryi SP2]ELY72097.1 aminoglycoside phosphotransferase [Natronobacterium gregoryi SP2]PLK19772.1 aminoglycoside phosphotransferase [Natronobacterium gregoryi SP2]SFJ41051.1 RIO1 family protein [Natronobacterium gregoryi]